MNQYIRQGWSGTWVLAALIGMVVAARAEESAIDSAEELTLTAKLLIRSVLIDSCESWTSPKR